MIYVIVVDGFKVEMTDESRAMAFVLLCLKDGKSVTISKVKGSFTSP